MELGIKSKANKAPPQSVHEIAFIIIAAIIHIQNALTISPKASLDYTQLQKVVCILVIRTYYTYMGSLIEMSRYTVYTIKYGKCALL